MKGKFRVADQGVASPDYAHLAVYGRYNRFQVTWCTDLYELEILAREIGFALAYLAWIWKDRKGYGRVGMILGLIGSAGIFVHLTCAYISTLPSHAPLRMITGLATNRSFQWFDHFQFDLHA